MTPLRVGIDIDGCMYDFTSDYYRYVKKYHGIVMRGQPTSWTWYKDYGITTPEFLAHLRDGSERGVIFHSYGIEKRAPRNLERVREQGHTLHVATDRGRFGPEAINATTAWLHHHYVPFDSLTFTPDKALLKFDMAIDDSPVHLDALYEAGVFTVRYDRPWNHGHRAHMVIANWDELPLAVAAAYEWQLIGAQP